MPRRSLLFALLSSAACAQAAPPVEVQIGPTAPARSCAEGERWDGARCVRGEDPPASGPCPAGMALVPGGTLSRSDVEKIIVRAVCMDVTEVTVAAYADCVRRGACSADKLDIEPACNHGREDRRDHPINCVSWEQANRYCRTVGKRLPTTPEWTWAAGGGRERRKFPWGAAAPDEQLCWSGKTARSGTCPVGSFRNGRSPQGIDDLVGNVWEWASPKIRNGVANVTGAASWQNSDEVDIFRENSGNFEPQFERNDVVGFRCALDPASAERRD